MRILFALSFAFLFNSTAFAELLPFQAKYEAQFKGVDIAQAQRFFHPVENGQFELVQSASALGSSLNFRQQARVSFNNGEVISHGFVQRQRGPFNNVDAQGFPTSDGGYLINVKKKPNLQFDAPEGVKQLLDSASFSLQLQRDIKQGLTEMTYHYATLEELESYHFEVVGKERIETPLGAFNTIKVVQQKNQSRATYLWLAADYDYQLVKAEIFRKGSLWANLALTYLRLNSQEINLIH